MPSVTPRRPYNSQSDKTPGGPGRTSSGARAGSARGDAPRYDAPLEHRPGVDPLLPLPQPAPAPIPAALSQAPATPTDPGRTIPGRPRPAAPAAPPPPAARLPGVSSRPAVAETTAERPQDRRNPRVQAALCYAFPFIPALLCLARERRNRFVRQHAAQAIAFFALIALAQSLLFAVAVGVGGLGLDLPVAVVVGLVFYGLFAIVGLLGLIFWLDSLLDAFSGSFRRYPLVTALARRIERTARRIQRFHTGAPREE